MNTEERWEHFHTTKTGGPHRKLHRERYWWISDEGNVKVTNNYNEDIRWVSVSLTGGHEGSRYAALSKNDLPSKYVHRLVAMHYCDNPFDRVDRTINVDHVDGNKMNNHYTNLQWVTAKENNARWRARRAAGEYTPSCQDLVRVWTRAETDAIIVSLYASGLSTGQIQKRLGLTQSRVWRPVKNYRRANGMVGRNRETIDSKSI